MKTSEIIDGLEDLIQDRKSFATPGNDKFYGKDNPFRYDIEVLQAAINELNCRAEPENKPEMSPKHKVALAKLVKMMDEDENGLTVEELANAYLNNCDGPCDGDQTTGIAPCKFWVMPDVDDNYNPTKGYCKLEAYRRKPKGSEKNE